MLGTLEDNLFVFLAVPVIKISRRDKEFKNKIPSCRDFGYVDKEIGGLNGGGGRGS